MKLHRKLLVYFISLVLSVLLAFGYINYQITHSANIDNERQILHVTLQYHADVLASRYREQPGPETLRHYLRETSRPPFSLYLLNQDNQYLLESPAASQPVPPPESLAQAESGQFHTGGRLCFWERRPLPGTTWQLLQIYHSQYDSNLLNSLSARMLITGLIILWLAGWLGLIMSTTISRKLQAQTRAIRHQSTHDNLTGLPNRLLLYDKLEKAIRRFHEEDGPPLALIVMDLNHFKEVNDTLGHDIGDRLLCQIGERLQALLGDTDILARMGGDEFAILLACEDKSRVRQTIDRIIDALQKNFLIKGLLLETETSLGIACCPEHGEDARTLIRHADTAMYLAKRHNESFAFYDSNRDPHSLKRLTLMGDLRRAIETDELELCYQPKVEIAAQRIPCVEALLRWPHPIYGYIQPTVFIALAEQTGIIKPLTWWTLETGIAQCARWHQQGRPLTVAINLSPRMLHDLGLPDEIRALLDCHELDAGYLELEITESAIMQEPERAQLILQRLHDMGVKLSIDDFGTGYTSLAYLKNLPVDEIKIDMSFIQGMLGNRTDAMIVRSIIELAHNMGYQVVAEGISSEALFRRLAREGCELAQGSFISHAMSAADFDEWYRHSRWNGAAGTGSEPAVVLPLSRDNDPA